MTKASDFIFSSDYLTLAQVNKITPQTFYFPARQFPVSGGKMQPITVEYNIVAPSVKGAIDRIQITYGGIKYNCSQFYRPPDFVLSGGTPWYSQCWIFWVYRKDEKTLVARCDFVPPSSASPVPSTPALTFTVSAVSFRPPNVF